MAEPLFDINTFLQTTHKGGMDTTFVLPPEGDYRAQSTDKVSSASGTVSEGDYAGNIWGRVELQWELQDDTLKAKLNMPKILVRQSLMLDFDQDAWHKHKKAVIDWGINKNMATKRLLAATGLDKLPQWNWNMLKHQPALVTVKYRRPEGFTDNIAEVSRVAKLTSIAQAATG